MSDAIEQAAKEAKREYERAENNEELGRYVVGPAMKVVGAHLDLLANPLPFILSLLPEAKWKRSVTDYHVGHKPDQRYSWEASNGGHYSVRFDGEENLWTWSAVYVDYYDETGPFECPSLEAGQAACRADFERRVAEIFNLTKGDERE